MADIFISYSSKDREKAEQLIELLASAGLSVWIDKSGIEVATTWSGEIVDAIEGCKAFVVLLSPNSIESVNVVKEVSLAAELKKKIVPLDLEPVELSRDLRYHLSGIQRSPMTNIDAIIRVFGKIGLEATQAPSIKLVKEPDGRKSLMILPFEDLSPTGDNGWFADGLATELISALSNVKALRVTDQQTTKEYKSYKGHLTMYAREMSIRYFIQGSVRKFGDQIKISVSLLDIETGDHLWQDSLKGTMDGIFDIQEKVAEKVVEGLRVHLARDEREKLAERDTKNAEAYELYMKAIEYFQRHTKEDFRHAVQLSTEAIQLDPNYASAHQFKANALVSLYRFYDQTPALLDEGEIECKEALRSKPDLFKVYQQLSQIYMYRGQLAEAEAMAKLHVQSDPQNSYSHATLGLFYMGTDQPSSAIAPFEAAVRLSPDSIALLWNLTVCCDNAGEHEKCRTWATVALPIIARHLKLHPDDEGKRVWQSALLFSAGKISEARTAALNLTNLRDGMSLTNRAILLLRVGELPEAIRTIRRAIEADYRNAPRLKDLLSTERDGMLSLQGTPEYEEVKRMVEQIESDDRSSSEANANG